MRTSLISGLLVASVSIFVSANYAVACGGYGESEELREDGVVLGDRFVHIDKKGNLVSANMIWGSSRLYGNFELQLLKYIAAEGDRAFVLTKDEVCEVSLKTGKLLRRQKHEMGICGVGIIDADKVFLNNGFKMAIVNLKTGKTLHQIDLKCNLKAFKKVGKSKLISHSRVGNLVYVARPFTNGVAVVDLSKGNLVREIKTDNYGWATNVHATPNNLFVRQWSSSYGIRTETLFLVDLKTQKVKAISLNNAARTLHFGLDKSAAPTTMLGTDDGGVVLAVRTTLMRFDAKGTLVNKTPEQG
ncbi:MAG: hypothetical protein ACI9G1_000931 [Pirellulaceae bacterium]|jgi:hypothetical protein